jgi:hypothetical protein
MPPKVMRKLAAGCQRGGNLFRAKPSGLVACPTPEKPMARHHEIPATPENMVWGYLDGQTRPVLSVNSGDTVTLHSFPAGGKETLPEDLTRVPADYLHALETLVPGPGPHFITGPVYIHGAQPDDALQIDIIDVKVVTFCNRFFTHNSNCSG